MSVPFQKLNDRQLDRLSEVFANLGVVFFVTLVLPLFSGIESLDPLKALWGLILAIGCVIMSLYFLRNRRKRP